MFPASSSHVGASPACRVHGQRHAWQSGPLSRQPVRQQQSSQHQWLPDVQLDGRVQQSLLHSALVESRVRDFAQVAHLRQVEVVRIFPQISVVTSVPVMAPTYPRDNLFWDRASTSMSGAVKSGVCS
jgi:hypothetical protein